VSVVQRESETSSPLTGVEATGPPPFITRRVFRRRDGSEAVWHSRNHRKGLALREATQFDSLSKARFRSQWMLGQLNWWIAAVFATGSMLFAVASILLLWPALAQMLSLGARSINALYFAGSIPFTVAAYLQLFQAANAPAFPGGDTANRKNLNVVEWKPRDIGWLSCALQFVGTILFNLNTLDAMIASLTWLEADLLVWGPDFIGSTFFLASGYLAFIETCHKY
jgi:hypothetical protein